MYSIMSTSYKYMMRLYKISVIIPVYNCEKYISDCLNSVLAQSCDSIEIICINDGSTDGSSLILEQYARKSSNISIINQENLGSGIARNNGLDVANGKYIAFLDGDDYYIDMTALESMVMFCEENDIAVCGSKRKILCNDKTTDMKLFNDVKISAVYCYNDVQIDYDYQSFIFRRDVIEDIRFPYYKRFQDPPFFVRVMHKAEKFAVIDKYLYCYRQENFSKKFDREKLGDLLCGLKDNLVFANENNLDKLFYKTLERIEYEYGDIIYHYMSTSDCNQLRLLMDINKLVQKYVHDNSYTLRPIHRFMEDIQVSKKNYAKDLIDRIKKNDRIVVYGAGRLAKNFVEFLKNNALLDKVDCFVVTQKESDSIDGISIYGIDECDFNGKRVLIATGVESQYIIEENLKSRGIENVELLDTVFLESCDKNDRKYGESN